MKINDNVNILIPETIMLIIIGFFYLPLMIYIVIAAYFDYLIRNYYVKKQKWDLNICCGNTDGGGINADIVKRNVPNFVLIKNIYKLPFKDKHFRNIICSHTIEHVKNPDKFFKELKRVSKNVSIVLPPMWDFFSFLHFREHKWQFLTLRMKHLNSLPRKIKLPYWWIHRLFGQNIV